jgi:pimeloyl-ACP methyl ester carboxylesterase
MLSWWITWIITEVNMRKMHNFPHPGKVLRKYLSEKLILIEVRLQMIGSAEHHVARVVAARMPNAKSEVFAGHGHMLHLEASGRFHNRVLEFLASARQSGL